MLSYTQFLILELSSKCNYSHLHPKCPVSLRNMKKKITSLSDDKIVNLAVEAYEKHNFTGLIGFHFYSEPLLQNNRMVQLIKIIKKIVPKSRFVLWTNGAYIDSAFDVFDKVFVTNYYDIPSFYFKQYFSCETNVLDVKFDDRISYEGFEGFEDSIPCYRPFIECIIDAYGEMILCCQDWDNRIKIGNVNNSTFEELLIIRDSLINKIKEGDYKDLPVCVKCQGKSELSNLDSEVYFKTINYLNRWI